MPPLALLLALAASSQGDIALAERSPFRHVRSTQERIERLLDIGTGRSPTFARLRALLELTDVIVYVQAQPGLPPGIDGRLRFMNAEGFRYLRVEVRYTLAQNEMLAIIGHELQHAVEIAGAGEVRDIKSMASLYRRIGTSRTAQSHFETRAARATGFQVRSELW